MSSVDVKTQGSSETGRGQAIVIAGLAAVVATAALLYAAMGHFQSHEAPPRQTAQNVSLQAGAPYRVYYFHRTFRCPSCETIEALSKAVVEEDFQAELALNNLAWKAFNLDDKENQHFEDDYNLQAQSVVLSEVHDGKEVRWKNLGKVWDLLDDEAAFRDYIKQEVQVFLTGQQENES